MRVLHVVKGLGRGGIETWLMHLLRHIDREKFRFDFLLRVAERTAYEEEAESLGARVLRFGGSRALGLSSLLEREGPYDAIHVHRRSFAPILRAAYRANIPKRIAHSHNAPPRRVVKGSRWRRWYENRKRRQRLRHATHAIGCSEAAASALFGTNWKRDARCSILYCSVDLQPFRRPVERRAVLRDLGIPSGSWVLGHVGRFSPSKNHAYLVDLFARFAERRREAHLLLVGEGEGLSGMVQHVLARGLSERVTFAGSRSDIPRILLGAMDVFLLPSLYEGLPLVGLEAQAAGLPLLVSDAVTEEMDVVPELINRLSLDAPASWLQALEDIRSSPRRKVPALGLLEASPFSIRRALKLIQDVYSG